MSFQTLDSLDSKHRRVLVRVDFNIEPGESTYRIRAAADTLRALMADGQRKIALATHLGRPDGHPQAEFSVARLKEPLEEALGVRVVLASDCIGPAVSLALESLSPGEVLLLENLRFHPGEEQNDQAFAESLAAPFDGYVNEAFSVCHRAHASVEAITRFLPAFAGMRLCRETGELDRVLEDPKRPAVLVLGGAKIETKLPLIRAFETRYDAVLVGGKIANEALDQKLAFAPTVILPTDFSTPERFDIGAETSARYARMIEEAGSVVWNGPMGKFEEPAYARGTQTVLEALLKTEGYTLAGGGESLQALEEAGAIEKLGFVSTGGGAMLAYLAGDGMPGLTALGS
jgi:phosphoglycerate kinase